MATASAALELYEDLRREQGESITYRRGNDTLTLQVVVAATEAIVRDAQGVATRVVLHDFLIRADELQLNATRFKPTRGDEIDWTFGTTTKTYAVHHPDANEPPFTDWDRFGQVYRTHTVLAAEA
jgi:hypothetical protein